MRYKIGVDVGGSNVRVALGDTNDRIVCRLSERSDKLSGPEGLSQQIMRMVSSLGVAGKINCIGIGSAGPLDLEDGSIVRSPHLGFDRIPLVEPLKKELRVPVHLTNDCVAAVVAEKKLGQGREYANIAYVTLSSGIGAGVFVDDRLLMGKDGNAHEVGHIVIDCSGELTCGCGKRGHWEAYCGGANAPNFIQLQLQSRSSEEIRNSLLYGTSGGDMDKLTSKDLFELANKGDELALEIVEEMGRLNAVGFANVTCVYDPELIVVGGAIALANPDLVLKPIKELIGQFSINRIPRIGLTQLGEDVVLYGTFALSEEPT